MAHTHQATTQSRGWTLRSVLLHHQKGSDVKTSSSISIVVAVAASALLLAGCASGSSTGGSTASTRACVILPDSASSPRWESLDRPALTKAFTDAGFDADVQNAQGDTNKYATIADQQLTKGCGVMVLVDYNGAALAVAQKAAKQGIPVIAYDRPITTGKGDATKMVPDYYVSFDNEKVGELEGQMIVDGLKTAGKDPSARGRRRHRFLGVGSSREGRQGRRRLQRLVRGTARDAPPR